MTEKDLKASLSRMKAQVDAVSSIYKGSADSINLPDDIRSDVNTYISSLKGASKESLEDLLTSSPEKLEEIAQQILKKHS